MWFREVSLAELAVHPLLNSAEILISISFVTSDLFSCSVERLTSFIIILLMVSAVASVLVNATGPKAADPLSYTTGGASMGERLEGIRGDAVHRYNIL